MVSPYPSALCTNCKGRQEAVELGCQCPCTHTTGSEPHQRRLSSPTSLQSVEDTKMLDLYRCQHLEYLLFDTVNRSNRPFNVVWPDASALSGWYGKSSKASHRCDVGLPLDVLTDAGIYVD
eukprot:m.113236 g.113236  ORF g.113236 m.113236 type:complete len:121 (-) comp15438_c0_seq18:1083-1445(-)